MQRKTPVYWPFPFNSRRAAVYSRAVEEALPQKGESILLSNLEYLSLHFLWVAIRGGPDATAHRNLSYFFHFDNRYVSFMLSLKNFSVLFLFRCRRQPSLLAMHWQGLQRAHGRKPLRQGSRLRCWGDVSGFSLTQTIHLQTTKLFFYSLSLNKSRETVAARSCSYESGVFAL